MVIFHLIASAELTLPSLIWPTFFSSVASAESTDRTYKTSPSTLRLNTLWSKIMYRYWSSSLPFPDAFILQDLWWGISTLLRDRMQIVHIFRRQPFDAGTLNLLEPITVETQRSEIFKPSHAVEMRKHDKEMNILLHLTKQYRRIF